MAYTSKNGIHTDVLAGRVSADMLPTQQALRAQQEERQRDKERRGFTNLVERDGYIVPAHVLAAEAKDGIKRTYLRRGDFSGWVKPVFKPQEIKDLEARTKIQYAYDFRQLGWRPFTELYGPMPPEMKAQADAWFPDENDPRRPVFDPESGDRGGYRWPAGAPAFVGDEPERPDLVTENGYPLTGPVGPHMGDEVLQEGKETARSREETVQMATYGEVKGAE